MTNKDKIIDLLNDIDDWAKDCPYEEDIVEATNKIAEIIHNKEDLLDLFLNNECPTQRERQCCEMIFMPCTKCWKIYMKNKLEENSNE